MLLVEDDAQVCEYVAKGLREHGHVVDVSGNGREAVYLGNSERYDVLVLDRMLPELDGLSALKEIRGSGNATPVLILSALDQVNEKVEGLRSGADDYLAKPFSFAELLARVEVLGRRDAVRINEGRETELRIHNLVMDLLSRTVSRAGQRIELHAKEFSLLEYLMRHAGQVVSRTMLLEQVWHYHFDPQTNVIEVHISRIRSKVDKAFPEEPSLLRTVRGMGYMLEEPF